MSTFQWSKTLGLRAGEWVEVRSQQDVLATLDSLGQFENVPFMPEMFQYCGRRLKVYKRADKTCDYVDEWHLRRITDCVHLDSARCDGSGHDGCEAGCLIFWKEAWLKRCGDAKTHERESCPVVDAKCFAPDCTMSEILAATLRTDDNGQRIYSCQVLEVRNFSSRISGFDPRQYLRDIRSGNLDTGLAGDSRSERILEWALAALQVLRSVLITLFNKAQGMRHGRSYPVLEGKAAGTPDQILNLQPGEVVEVRSKEEIMQTLDKHHRNRGLLFDAEMLPYCGGIYRVLRRVNRIIDEKTGKMITMKYPCIVLEGVFCRASFHRLCPRSIYTYWRESWLKRAKADSTTALNEVCNGSCE